MTSQPAATLRARLVDQAASDLEENRRRQQELTEKVRLLKQEEALLVDILKLAERYESLAESSPLSEQSREEPAPAGARSRRASAAPSGDTPARQAARTGKPARKAAEGKSRQPPLGDLLLSLLAGHDGPLLAKELRDELLEKHPDRNPTPQVVRNTLESLVAKGHIRRRKQQRSVTYALEESGRRALAAQQDDSAADN
ncbi:hypothetical protein [Streptomyces sp. NK15101]|uniref:hypothetical protein n=1 Tax=Streptomyces sp. NK15101 TaxID=2873261 RepID=UPI001CEDF24B|nr:hypothetical protein [Streptomyces sp. NK15101]